MSRARILTLLAMCFATSPLGCRLPPERNPPAALSTPVTVTVVVDEEHPLAEVALLAVRRLNESRGPDERPVKLNLGLDPVLRGVIVPVTTDIPPTTRSLILLPRERSLPARNRADPRFPSQLRSTDVQTSHSLGVYDAVVIAGVTARARPEGTPEVLLAWLRSQPGWRLSLGEFDYKTTLDPDFGPRALMPGSTQ